MVNILGFMMYIWTLVNPTDQLIGSKAKAVFNQLKKDLIELKNLKKNDAGIADYKEVLSKLVDQCESFSDIGSDAGTDLMEDLYVSLFDQLRQSINSDLPAEQVPTPEMNALQQMIAESLRGEIDEDQSEPETYA